MSTTLQRSSPRSRSKRPAGFPSSPIRIRLSAFGYCTSYVISRPRYCISINGKNCASANPVAAKSTALTSKKSANSSGSSSGPAWRKRSVESSFQFLHSSLVTEGLEQTVPARSSRPRLLLYTGQLRDGKMPTSAMMKFTVRYGWIFGWGTLPPDWETAVGANVPVAAAFV